VGCPVVGAGGGTVAGPVGWPYVGAVVVPCAQAAEADKASKETPNKILFISHSFDLCEAFLCGTRLYEWQNTLMMQIVPSAEWRFCRIVTAMWWWRHTFLHSPGEPSPHSRTEGRREAWRFRDGCVRRRA
jgi:hypothetical protein